MEPNLGINCVNKIYLFIINNQIKKTDLAFLMVHVSCYAWRCLLHLYFSLLWGPPGVYSGSLLINYTHATPTNNACA